MDVLDKRFTKKHDLNQSTLVALGSLNLILVIVVYPIVRKEGLNFFHDDWIFVWSLCRFTTTNGMRRASVNCKLII